jgi:hypothetical protein
VLISVHLKPGTGPSNRARRKEELATNTNLNGPQPYDHVFYNTTHSSEIDEAFDFEVVNLIEKMRSYWTGPDYPGDPYVHNTFRTIYSDHHPVTFKMNVTTDDD